MHVLIACEVLQSCSVTAVETASTPSQLQLANVLTCPCFSTAARFQPEITLNIISVRLSSILDYLINLFNR